MFSLLCRRSSSVLLYHRNTTIRAASSLHLLSKHSTHHTRTYCTQNTQPPLPSQPTQPTQSNQPTQPNQLNPNQSNQPNQPNQPQTEPLYKLFGDLFDTLKLHSENEIAEYVKNPFTAPEGIKSYLEKPVDNGRTPLHCIPADMEVTEFKKLVLVCENFLNTETSKGTTPLIRALAMKRPDLMRVLLDTEGISKDSTNRDGLTILHYAASVNLPEAVRMLISEYKMDVNIRGTDDSTPLMYSINGEVARVLLELGADVNAKHDKGTVLHYAARYARIDVIKVAVAAGADLEARENKNDTPLVTSFKTQNYELTKTLIDLGANVNAKVGSKLELLMERSKNVPEIMDYLNAGIPENFKDGTGTQTILHIAALEATPEVFKLLLERGSRIEPNILKATPFHVAAASSNLPIITLMLKEGQDINSADYCGYTPISNAVLKDQLESVKMLVELGADLTRLNSQGRTLMHYVKPGPIMEFLAQSKAPINVRDNSGATPLMLAVRMKEEHAKIEPLVKAGAKVDEPDAKGLTPLHYAISYGLVNPIKHLIKAGANVNRVDSHLEPPIHTAARFNIPDIVKELLPFNPKVDLVSHGRTAMFVAGCAETVKLLVDAGAEINFPASTEIKELGMGSTPLHAVSSMRDSAIVRAMLECGANVNAQNLHGHTPIMLACRNKDVEVYNTLKEFGANIKHVDKYGNTLLAHAVEMHNNHIFEELLSKGFKWDVKNQLGLRPLHAAASSGNLTALSRLVKLGGDIHEPDKAGDTPLHYATNGKSLEMMEELVKLGANVESVNDMGWSPLVFACLGATNLIPFYVSKGVNLNRQDKNGNTPMHLAIIHAGNIPSVKELLKHGADKTIKNNKGLTPADEAANRGFQNAFEL